MKKLNHLKSFENKQIDKKKELSDFAKELFKNEYKDNMTNDSYKEFQEYDKKIIKKAIELGFDTDELYIDGECFGYEGDEEYDNITKTMWIEYFDHQIFYYEWK